MLQNALKEVRAALKEQGTQVISRGRIRSTPLQGALQDIATLRRVDADPSVGEEVKARIAAWAKIVLLTNEDLLSRINIRYCFRAPEHGLRLLQSIFPGLPMKVILYTRAQADYIESTYTQHVQTGHNLSFEDYLGDGLPTHLQWDGIADRIASVVGQDNVSVAPYEMIFQMGAEAFFRDFLRRVGLSAPQVVPFQEPSGRGSNRSYSRLAVNIWRQVEPLLETEDQRKNFRAYLQAEFSTATLPRAEWLSPDQRQAIKDIYHASNARLFAQYMPEHNPNSLGYV